MSERPISTYRDALTRITDAAFGKRGASFASVPARPDRDADLLLADALNELERLRRERDTPIPAEETIAGLKAEVERLRAVETAAQGVLGAVDRGALEPPCDIRLTHWIRELRSACEVVHVG